MIFKEDIHKRIESDFGNQGSEALKLIQQTIQKTDYIKHDRIIRCIVFLAEKKLDKLKDSIQAAINDPRDVMFWAEYVNPGSDQRPKRVRDFNQTFDACETNVKE